jgi:large conductance mechanosensitive channel
VLPYNTLRRRGEVEQADDAQIVLLTEIRDLLAESNGGSSGKHGGTTTTPPPNYGPRADAESQ